MPIEGSYSWKEKIDSVKISIPTKGVSPSKIDIFVASSVLKVNYSPYLIDIVLLHPVDSLRHKASISNGVLNITLFKLEPGIWGQLFVDDKSVSKELRQESISQQFELEGKLTEMRRDKKVEDERFSLRKQMSLDESSRARLDDLKKEEKEAAEAQMYETFSKLQAEEELKKSQKKSKGKSTKSVSWESVPQVSDVVQHQQTSDASTRKDIFSENDVFESFASREDIDDNKEKSVYNSEVEEVVDGEEDWEIVEAVDDSSANIAAHKVPSTHRRLEEKNDGNESDEDVRFIPPPRSAGISRDSEGKIEVNFTPRVFPTPLRESKMAEEQDWVAKHRKHLKNHAVLRNSVTRGNDVDISEEDASWLKAKADDFFRSGDVQSAINAYTAALDADPNMVSCYANRSACYLKQLEYGECLDDCKKAVGLLANSHRKLDASKDAKELIHDFDFSNCAESDRKLLVKLLLRKGTCFCSLGLFSEALSDFETVEGFLKMGPSESSLLPMPEEFRGDLETIRKLSRVDALKKAGDACFADRLLQEAEKNYSTALELVPVHVGCLSNRSAARLASGDVDGCISDCSTAIKLLQVNMHSDASPNQKIIGAVPNLNILTAVLPPPGSEKRKEWVLKTITRRGAALAQRGDVDDAIEDYRTACSLDPNNDALKVDLNKLRNSREGKKSTQ